MLLNTGSCAALPGTPRRTAFANLVNLRRTPGRKYEIEVIDLLENRLARGDQILAIPTLVRKLPYLSKRSSATSQHREPSRRLDMRPVKTSSGQE
jgi:circadian clock protein KaiB